MYLTQKPNVFVACNSYHYLHFSGNLTGLM